MNISTTHSFGSKKPQNFIAVQLLEECPSTINEVYPGSLGLAESNAHSRNNIHTIASYQQSSTFTSTAILAVTSIFLSPSTSIQNDVHSRLSTHLAPSYYLRPVGAVGSRRTNLLLYVFDRWNSLWCHSSNMFAASLVSL